MSSISEIEVIEFLKQRKSLLIKEIENIDNMIFSLSGNTEINEVIYKQRPDSAQPTRSRIPVPESYNSNLKIDEKIVFAISKLNSADRNEIIDWLLEAEPNAEEQKLRQNITTRLSVLRKNKQIGSQKVGPRFKYQLI